MLFFILKEKGPPFLLIMNFDHIYALILQWSVMVCGLFSWGSILSGIDCKSSIPSWHYVEDETLDSGSTSWEKNSKDHTNKALKSKALSKLLWMPCLSKQKIEIIQTFIANQWESKVKCIHNWTHTHTHRNTQKNVCRWSYQQYPTSPDSQFGHQQWHWHWSYQRQLGHNPDPRKQSLITTK